MDCRTGPRIPIQDDKTEYLNGNYDRARVRRHAEKKLQDKRNGHVGGGLKY
jgi:hypothetical protein